MRVVFLDVDGVINSYPYRKANRAWYARDAPEALLRIAEIGIDSALVERLNRVVDAYDDVVFVLSSAWRITTAIDDMQIMLEHRGFRGRLIDATPTCAQMSAVEKMPRGRGDEIDYWLRVRAPRANLPIYAFAILDDRADMEPHMHALVQTDDDRGLTDEDVERVIALLR